MKYDDHDIEIAAKTVWGEARGEGGEGRLAVAHVIRNRAERLRFAENYLGKEGAAAHVCLKPWQFSCWLESDPNREKMLNLPAPDWAEEGDLVEDVFNGVTQDPTLGADHYFAVSIPAPDWASAFRRTVQIGHHVFYDSRPVNVGQLSEHFNVNELVHSDIATDLGIPNVAPASALANLGKLAANVLEPARKILGHPMIISSGFRSPQLNSNPAVRGATNSDHLFGCAADFRCPGFGTPGQIVAALVASDVPYKQIIFEHPYGLANTWVHISWADGEPRREALESTAPGVYVPWHSS